MSKISVKNKAKLFQGRTHSCCWSVAATSHLDSASPNGWGTRDYNCHFNPLYSGWVLHKFLFFFINVEFWNLFNNLKTIKYPKCTRTKSTFVDLQEANEASCVGFMRSGRILAEGSPQEMTLKFATSSLEDVFYKICISSETKDEVANLSCDIRYFLSWSFVINGTKRDGWVSGGEIVCRRRNNTYFCFTC